MIQSLGKKLFGTKNDRYIKSLQPILDQVNALEPEYRHKSDQALRDITKDFRKHIQEKVAAGQEPQAVLDELLPQAFAVCREAGKRVLMMRHFDVQIIGGIVLHQGRIAEMRTGEGKTLVATLPVFLNGLLGRGVHVVTVNDYLAQRDSEWMGQLYNFLGLSVGVVVHGMDDHARQEAYQSDVTYGQNNEFGFDYLRDNMKFQLEHYVQRDLYYAIVDEVDSILIDEARTPLIISGPTDDSTDKYYVINNIIPNLKKDVDFTLDEKAKNAMLTEDGIANLEKLLNIDNLYDPKQMDTLHHVQQSLKAHTLFQKDVDYMVRDGEVVIVDEFTGRLMPGRRWSDGLHQAVEAKEGVTVANENQTLASITFQNYFRMFDKLSGMTGTADTEAEEFGKIYELDVVVIPTNKPMIRNDQPDVIYRSVREKFDAIAKEIKELNEKGQPVLVGTVSIESSERLSKYLKRYGIQHNVLNAKHHEREAEIVMNAGQKGQVTIATNMAGRGTDIGLGEGVKELGGLCIIGTERHESRRIDNQLRGRSGRQGDPGASRFYLSLEDDLMRIFGGDRAQRMIDLFGGMQEGEAIESGAMTKLIESSQRQVEAHNFDIRKHLLKYDDVMTKQRKVIYALRKDVLGKEDIRHLVHEDIEDVVEATVLAFTDAGKPPAEWDWEKLSKGIQTIFDAEFEINAESMSVKTLEELRDKLCDRLEAMHRLWEEELTPELARRIEREVKLRTIDALWKDHLLGMDQLKEAVGFEGYAQKDPLVVYQKKGFEMFSEMVYAIKELSVERIFHLKIAREEAEETAQAMAVHEAPKQMTMKRGVDQKVAASAGRSVPQSAVSGDPQGQGSPESGLRLVSQGQQGGEASAVTFRRDGEKVGRNDPCPCGSGKKYKKCHGA